MLFGYGISISVQSTIINSENAKISLAFLGNSCIIKGYKGQKWMTCFCLQDERYDLLTCTHEKVVIFRENHRKKEMQMDAYTSFAQVYDLFMDNVPYDAWADYIRQWLMQEGILDGVLLDLGCGTGKMTRRMAASGYDMIGVDLSLDMLEIAREAEYEALEEYEVPDFKEDTEMNMEENGQEAGILYLLQDMRELELYEPVLAIYSACDCLNYILEEEELLHVFFRVAEALKPGGAFLFDMNTLYKYEELLADHTFAENRDEGSFIWENDYDNKTQINEYDLTLYVAGEDGVYERFYETHYQRGYSSELVVSLLEKAGFTDIHVYDAYTKNPLSPESDRMTVTARKPEV